MAIPKWIRYAKGVLSAISPRTMRAVEASARIPRDAASAIQQARQGIRGLRSYMRSAPSERAAIRARRAAAKAEIEQQIARNLQFRERQARLYGRRAFSNLGGERLSLAKKRPKGQKSHDSEAQTVGKNQNRQRQGIDNLLDNRIDEDKYATKRLIKELEGTLVPVSDEEKALLDLANETGQSIDKIFKDALDVLDAVADQDPPNEGNSPEAEA